MTNPNPLVEAVKNSIQLEKLEAVLRAAGAQRINDSATEVLREVAAAEAVRKEGAALALPRVDAKIMDAARASLDMKALQPNAPKGFEARVAHELGGIAAAAAEVARAEGRPVCHSCVAIGAAQIAAAQAGPAEMRP